MQSVLPVLAVLGGILMMFSATMLVPLAVAYFGGDAGLPAYDESILITFASGLLLWLATRKYKRELQPRDGFLLVSLAWTVLTVFASLPLLFYFRQAGTPISFTDAYFEAMSGLTTTGATTLSGLDSLPPSINLWRCFLQWLGGMGILVLAVAILPLLGVGGSQLFKAESAGPLKETKLTPRIAETAKGLWGVYGAISLLCVLAYRLGGMSWFDAWVHMFSTMSLGGLSSHDASFGYFKSPLLEWIGVVFMVIASCNFAVYFVALRKRSLRHVINDLEARGTVALMVAGSLLVAAFLLWKGTYTSVEESMRMSFFNVVSIASTTGYASTDFGQWPMFAPLLMLALSGMATSAGSTGAGIKTVRLIILFKQAKREMLRIVHKRVISPVKLYGQPVDNDTLYAVLAFMLVYGATVGGLTMLLVATDLNFVTALSAVVACVNNMGPGLNEVGPAGNFSSLTDFQTWVCTLAMLLGRLEMLSFLVLFTPQFWRK